MNCKNELEKELEKEKKQLLRIVKQRPHRTRMEWAIALGWLNSKEQPDYRKVTKLLKQLEADDFVIQIGHRYLVKS